MFLTLGNNINKNPKGTTPVEVRRFGDFFSTIPEIFSQLWNAPLGLGGVVRGGKPAHILWACLFLKMYTMNDVLSALIGADPNTFRKWTWLFIEAMSYLEADVVCRFSYVYIVIYLLCNLTNLIVCLFYFIYFILCSDKVGGEEGGSVGWSVGDGRWDGLPHP